MKGKYDALTIARYIINYCYTNNYSCSNLRLQKLLYFVQAKFLVNTKSGNPCFDDVIEAWKFGPIVPSVYHEYKAFGCGDIPYVNIYYEFNFNGFNTDVVENTFTGDLIKTDDKANIIEVINTYKDYSVSELVNLIHKQDPWINAYYKSVDHIITKESLVRYFSRR